MQRHFLANDTFLGDNVITEIAPNYVGRSKIKKYGEMCVFKIAHHKIHIKHNEQQFVCGSVAEKKTSGRTSTAKDATK